MKNVPLLTAIAIALLSSSIALPAQQSKPPATEPAPIEPEAAEVATQASSAGAAGADALRKASQNPIASLVSVPIQNNDNFGITPGNRTQNILNIQPVIPLSLNKDLNLVIRWITPIIYQPLPNSAPPNGTGVNGLGDMQPTFFLVPKKTTKIIYGGGLVVQLPTATSRYTGQGKLALGPSIVALAQPKSWTLGFLANNVTSVAGGGQRTQVNQFLLQYFINYNLKHGYYLTSAPTLTANWNGGSSGTWTVPFGGGAGRIMKLGFQPVNISGSFYGNAAYPSGTSSWNAKFQIAFLFPKLTKEQQIGMMEQRLKQLNEAPPPPEKK
jgi:hypothetical protein